MSDEVRTRDRRSRVVRRFLTAFLRGDLAAARALVTDDLDFQGVGTDGSRVDLRGFEAVADWVRRRDQELGTRVTLRMVDLLSSKGQVVLVFETDPPSAADQGARRLALWGFTGELISSVRVFSASDDHVA